MKLKIFNNEFNLVKAIKGNDTNQISIFGQPRQSGTRPPDKQNAGQAIAGAEKEFAPGDKRRLEVTSGGKLRWKNADEKSGQKAERRVQSEKKEEVNQMNLIKRYVYETGEKINNESDMEKVKNRYPQEWDKIQKDEQEKTALWKQLPEDFRKFRGINEYSTEGIKKLIDKSKEEIPTSLISELPKTAENEKPTWKYEEYNDWSRRLAQTGTKEELEKRLNKLNGEKDKLTQSHLNAIRKTTSMQSNSQRRAQTGNSVTAAYEERNALENALEIYKYYPEKTKGGLVKPKREITAPSYRPLQEGEESSVERKYKAYKELKFFAAHEKIETPDDVAYLFNQLQDETVEHGFIAHETKEHGIIVQHVSTGSFNSSIFDPKQIWDAIDRFGSVKIHMVHNHPSGNLQPSNEDISIWNKLKEGLPKNVEMMPGVILDAREGSYGFFEPNGPKSGEKQMPNINYGKGAKPVKALRFSRQIFNKNATLPKERITQPDDIVKFIYQGKYTNGNKAQVLALSNRNSVVGRFNLASSLDDPKQVADEIAVLLGRSGGISAIISTNKNFDFEFKSKLNGISYQLKIKDITLFDCVSVEKENFNNWKSAVYERVFESAAAKFVDKSILKTLLKAFGKQISLFGKEEPYSKEGQTKEGAGGTLQLTRDKTSKGAHWRILNKREPGDGDQKPAEEENKNKGKIITPAQAYDLLQDKLGNKTFITDKDGNLLGEGTFQLINENSEGNYSLFLSEKNGFDSIIPVPKNQAAMVMEGGVQFKFSDKNITISTKEKSKDATKPIEIEKAEENAKRARELEKMRNYNRWNEKAEDFAELGRGQKNWFFNDLEDVANLLNMEFSHNNRIIKNADTLFKEIKRNSEKYDKEEVHSALIGAFEVGSTFKMKRVISELKNKGYSIDAPDIIDKESFFTHVKISKGENDPCPKEIQFATPELALAAEECAKKPNALRETETSLKLMVKAERIPEYETIKKKLFNQAGEGLGQIWITGGLPGSGKSSILGGGFHKNKIVIDPDAIKYMIAEEKGISKEDVDKKPWEHHEDSSILAKHLTREAVRDGKDVIYDVTMKGTDNLTDILELVKNDTFQANAKFIHIPIEKGIERDKARGEKGGRSIGTELYKKLFSDYPTHKAFFQLKDDFDNFDVYDNSAPLGEGAKLFYQKIDGQEQIHHPDIHAEFQKIGRSKVEKSVPLTQSNKIGDEEMDIGNNAISDSDKIKMLFRQMNGGQVGFDEEHEIDPEQDFFELGMLKMHGLIDENMMLTPEGEQKFEKEFGSKIPMEEEGEETGFDSILNPKKNIADQEADQEHEPVKNTPGKQEQGQEIKKSKRISINIFGRGIKIGEPTKIRLLLKAVKGQLKLFVDKGQEDLFTGMEKDGKKLLQSDKNPNVRRWQSEDKKDKNVLDISVKDNDIKGDEKRSSEMETIFSFEKSVGKFEVILDPETLGWDIKQSVFKINFLDKASTFRFPEDVRFYENKKTYGIRLYKGGEVTKEIINKGKLKNEDVTLTISKDQYQALQNAHEKVVQVKMKKAEEETEAAKRELDEHKQKGTFTYFVFRGGDTYEQHIGSGFFDPEQAIKGDYVKDMADKIIFRNKATLWAKAEKEALPKLSFGDYGIPNLYGDIALLTEEEFNVYKEKKKKVHIAKEEEEKKEDDGIKKKFEEAKQTGKPQQLNRWMDECNDENEDCSLDEIIIFAMPDGTTKEKRFHTW